MLAGDPEVSAPDADHGAGRRCGGGGVVIERLLTVNDQ
jgi:hypothetical protein